MRAQVKYLAIIQAYRGLVAVMILMTHALTIWYMRGFELLGFVHSVQRSGGVDFFFTLSGFLISYIYLRCAGRPGEAGAFLERRLLRIYPLVWFFTLLSLPAYFMLRLVNCWFMLRATTSELLLRRRLTVYEKGH